MSSNHIYSKRSLVSNESLFHNIELCGQKCTDTGLDFCLDKLINLFDKFVYNFNSHNCSNNNKTILTSNWGKKHRYKPYFLFG